MTNPACNLDLVCCLDIYHLIIKNEMSPPTTNPMTPATMIMESNPPVVVLLPLCVLQGPTVGVNISPVCPSMAGAKSCTPNNTAAVTPAGNVPSALREGDVAVAVVKLIIVMCFVNE